MFINWFNMQKKRCDGIENLGIQNIFTPLRNIENTINVNFRDFISPDTKIFAFE